VGKLEDELRSLGFQKNRAANWTRKHDIVQIVRSSERPKLRVMWREYWKDFLAIIFDYSEADGPICIVPTSVLFNLPFISEKRKDQAYVNSGYYWSQLFNIEDSLAQLVLSFENRWDILGGNRGETAVWQAFSQRSATTLPLKAVIKRSEPVAVKVIVDKEPEFSGMLKAFRNNHLLHLYCDLMEELRERNIVRSGGNPVSDYGEKIVAERMNLKLSMGSNKGYDAIDENTGNRYQIKSRRLTKHNGTSSKQLGIIRNLDQKLFDYLVAVIFDEFLEPKEIWQIPFDVIPKYSKFSEHQNGHILILAGDILQEETVKKLL